MAVLSALVSLELTDEVEANADAWHALCVAGTSGLFEKMDPGLRFLVAGAVGEPDESGRLVEWRDASRAPGELALSFGPDLNYAEQRSVAPPGTAETQGAVSTTVDVSLDGVYLMLGCEIVGFDEVVGAQRVADALRNIVVDFASTHSVDFGNVAPDNSGGRSGTSLEVALRRREETCLREARQVLRGYAWTTVVPSSLAPVVAPRLAKIPQFQVRELASGALVIVATDDIGDYNPALWTKLFECLAPVLPSGTPRIGRPATGLQPKLLDPRDARDVSRFYLDSQSGSQEGPETGGSS